MVETLAEGNAEEKELVKQLEGLSKKRLAKLDKGGKTYRSLYMLALEGDAPITQRKLYTGHSERTEKTLHNSCFDTIHHQRMRVHTSQLKNDETIIHKNRKINVKIQTGLTVKY